MMFTEAESFTGGTTPVQSFGNRKGKCGLRQRKGKEKIWLGPKRKPPHNETQHLKSALFILFHKQARLQNTTTFGIQT